jgi:hypothetical protein
MNANSTQTWNSERVHLQWFATAGDEDPPALSFKVEEESEPEADVIEVPEDFELPPTLMERQAAQGESEPDDDVPDKYKGMTKAQLAAALEQQSSAPTQSGDLSQQFERLNENLSRAIGGRGPDENTAPQGPPPESDPDFWKRAGTEMFDDEKMPKVFQEAVSRAVAPRLAKVSRDAMLATKKVLEIDSATSGNYKRYATEIEAEAQKLVKQYGFDGEVYPYAYRAVMERHKDEVQNETVKAEVERQVRSTLKSLGIEVKDGEGGSTVRRPKGFQQAGSTTSAVGGATRRIKVTPEIKRMAEKMGITPEQYLGV